VARGDTQRSRRNRKPPSEAIAHLDADQLAICLLLIARGCRAKTSASPLGTNRDAWTACVCARFGGLRRNDLAGSPCLPCLRCSMDLMPFAFRRPDALLICQYAAARVHRGLTPGHTRRDERISGCPLGAVHGKRLWVRCAVASKRCAARRTLVHTESCTSLVRCVIARRTRGKKIPTHGLRERQQAL